jgi:hypothetical protein
MSAISMAAPWKEPLLASLKKNSKCAHSRYLQLATIGSDGAPANRTVVFRGFLDDDSDVLTIVTDARCAGRLCHADAQPPSRAPQLPPPPRSRKVQEVAANPAAEVAWYLTETREQYRIRGTLCVIDSATPSEQLQQASRRQLRGGA